MDTPHNNSKSDVELKHLSGVPVPAAQRQAQDAPMGAPPSNTAPSNCIEPDSESRVLLTGVDSLYLSYAGSLKPRVEENLEYLKKLAQSGDPNEQAGAIYCICDHRFEVKDKGKGKYPFVLEDGIFHIQLSRAKSTSMPMAYVQIRSEALTRTGVEHTVAALNNIISVLALTLSHPTVSRGDLSADFLTTCDLENIHKDTWLNRAIKRNSYEHRGRFSGINFGEGSALSARLYDKTLEIIVKSGKTYLYDIWHEAGWNDEQFIWRLEFQLKRNVLRELGINTVSDLLKHRADLWHYGTNWLRLVIPSSKDKTRARWPNHPLWDVLANAPWGVERGEPLTRTRKTRLPSDKSMFVNGIGGITSFMASRGITDIDEGFREYKKQLHAHHLEESRRTGKTLPTYVREKVMQKARLFNTAIKLNSKTV